MLTRLKGAFDKKRSGLLSGLALIVHSCFLRWFNVWYFPGGVKRARNTNKRSTLGNSTTNSRKQLLVDVSIIASQDAKTGIQRVVRSLLINLLADPPLGMTVRTIKATRKEAYQYANAYLSTLTGRDHGQDMPVEISGHDVFLGLDLTSRILPRRHAELRLWRTRGAKLAFVLYDLLPASHPAWFTPRAHKSFLQWLSTLAVNADALFCISASVSTQASNFFCHHYSLSQDSLKIRWFHLGRDLPSASQSINDTPLLPQRKSFGSEALTLLMVGTVEPRKGHALVVDAFERLWAQGVTVRLVIAGREGWNVPKLIERLSNHPENNGRLVWVNNSSDTELIALYSSCDGLIMASEAEGFGLPLVEAAHYGLPILARDLDVFREVAGSNATYFSSVSAPELAVELTRWIEALQLGAAPGSRDMPALTWRESCTQLKQLIAELEQS
jgi:glycosyltransferase involved in cell wall biosynthesis